MKFLRLGRSDLRVSSVGLGGFSFGKAGWMVGPEVAQRVFRRAVDIGINYIDTANVYSGGESERIIGKLIEGNRDNLILSTKVGGPMDDVHMGFSRKEMEMQIRHSLDRLRTDYLDIYLLHTWFDRLDIREIAGILDGLVKDGRTMYYGLSNVSGYQVAEFDTVAAERSMERPAIVQNHYNAVYREDERDVIPYCGMKSITYSPFSPLAAGFLSGKYRRGEEPDTVRSREYRIMTKRYFHDNDFDILDEITEVSSEQGATTTAVSLAYVMSRGFLPVVGISNPDHLDDVESAISINLSKEQSERIERNYRPHDVYMGTAGYQ